jgi:cytochrome c553
MTDLQLRNVLGALAGLALAVAAPAGKAAAAEGGVQAKIDYCQTCHGQSGQGYRGYYTMPRLAGQQPDYLTTQLHDFASGHRGNSIMAGVARGVPTSMYGAIASHFHALNPPPAGASGGDVALGRHIFADGLPESNVPACAACHGAEGHGSGQIPRLAGQIPSYLVKTLTNWTSERGGDSAGGLAAIMVPTTHNLTPAQIAAVAAYAGTLR